MNVLREQSVFDVAKADLWLKKLKWPRVTEAQLCKILMDRDGYME